MKGAEWTGGGSIVHVCFMCLCGLTLLFTTFGGVLAYSCVAVRCTSPFPQSSVCFLWLASRAGEAGKWTDRCLWLFVRSSLGPRARPDVCPVVSLGTLPLTCVAVYACVCGWLSLCAHHHTHTLSVICVCVSLSPGALLTQSASALIPEGADSGAARALPCPPNTRSC